jgi:hypothetical protein
MATAGGTRHIKEALQGRNSGLYCAIMSRILVLAINVFLVACMLVASPLLFVLPFGLGILRGVRVLARKIKHKRLGSPPTSVPSLFE